MLGRRDGRPLSPSVQSTLRPWAAGEAGVKLNSLGRCHFSHIQAQIAACFPRSFWQVAVFYLVDMTPRGRIHRHLLQGRPLPSASYQQLQQLRGKEGREHAGRGLLFQGMDLYGVPGSRGPGPPWLGWLWAQPRCPGQPAVLGALDAPPPGPSPSQWPVPHPLIPDLTGIRRGTVTA